MLGNTFQSVKSGWKLLTDLAIETLSHLADTDVDVEDYDSQTTLSCGAYTRSPQSPSRCSSDKSRALIGDIAVDYEKTGETNNRTTEADDFWSTQSPTMVNPGNGFFESSHDFVIKRQTNISQVQIIKQGDSCGFQDSIWKKRIIGVEVDSSFHQHLPRCHPETRKSLRANIMAWAVPCDHHSKGDEQVLWILGPAGVGKSTVARTIAEKAKVEGLLGASLFLSDVNGRDDLDRVPSTLACQLSVQQPEYKCIIRQTLAHDPSIVEKSLRVQFQELIVSPISTIMMQDSPTAWPKPLLIIIDGLDHCKSKQSQCELIELIVEHSRSVHKLPLLWMILSRPESHLEDLLSRPELSAVCKVDRIAVNRTEDKQDVALFLREEFSAISRRFSRFLPQEWPPEEALHSVITKVSGHFALAVIATHFVGDAVIDNPLNQLQIYLRALGKLETPGSSSLLEMIGLLYRSIRAQIAPSILPNVERILRNRGALDSNLVRSPKARLPDLSGGELFTLFAAQIPSIPNRGVSGGSAIPASFLRGAVSSTVEFPGPDTTLEQSLAENLPSAYLDSQDISGIRADSLELSENDLKLSNPVKKRLQNRLLSMISQIARHRGLWKSFTKKLSDRQETSEIQAIVEYLDYVLLQGEALNPDDRVLILQSLCELVELGQKYPERLVVRNINYAPQPFECGGFCDIYAIRGNQRLCVKVARIRLGQEDLRVSTELIREGILWSHLIHENILPFHGFYTPSDITQTVFLVSPLMQRRNVRIFLDRNPDTPRLPLVYGIIQGLSYMHDRNIIHGDLKALNILVSDFGRPLLADFGCSEVLSDAGFVTNRRITGTVHWMAPELIGLIGDGSATSRGKMSDIWSFGCTCYEMYTGEIPFHECKKLSGVMIALSLGKVPLRPDPGDSTVCLDFDDWIWERLMLGCWRKLPEDRYTCKGIIELLASRFPDFHVEPAASRKKAVDIPADKSDPEEVERIICEVLAS
ncbi:hypothetical protein NP233_g11890 [Leucocoprinus birnbaumii]|uniref:Protein kinase domain-containing protein n=1 Tax=Leucocoprinus birnbaumii TaxID=56174 RepID=A0AAD5YNJ1_9AGAR|nr:hypothetical protein NP233_g11890 [Leucocoprinus birnbaumii]